MGSLSPLKESAVDVPWKLLVAAAQPYQTLAGPALSVNFNFHPSLLPFQRLPFSHAAVPAVYFHSLLHSLAEFATTPRPVRSNHVRMLHAPMETFWRTVGVLNCVYYTSHGVPGAPHPAMGAVEMAAPPHRTGRDVRMSLYDAAHRPVATMIATGDRELHGELYGELYGELHGDPEPHAWLCEAALTAPSLEGVARRLPDGSVAHRVCFAPHNNNNSSDSENNNSNNSEDNSDAAPPWRVDATVAEFCAALAAGGHVPEPAAGKRWAIAAQQTHIQGGVVALRAPAEIVCAPPRVFAAYRLPPWRHRIGLPLFAAGAVAPRCVALRVEVRQRGATALAGTYCFAETPGT